MHRLGSVLPLAVPVVFGPGTGAAANPANTWPVAYPGDPVAKFLTLHIDGSALDPADRVEVDLGYDTDVFTRAWGSDFWTRPIKGPGPVSLRYVRTGASTGTARIDKYGRGEPIRDGGERNSNGDLFMIETPYDEPTYFPAESLTDANSLPSWQQAACVVHPVIQAVARSVGMYVVVHRDPSHNTLPEDLDFTRLTSCTATLIGPDLVITAGHCVATDDEIRTGSITFDFQTECDHTPPSGYSPRFYKLKKLVQTGFLRPVGDLRTPVDYSIIQVETPPGGFAFPPISFRPSTLPLSTGDPLFIVHHRRGTAKKVSSWLNDSNCRVRALAPGQVAWECSLDYGSSGSSIFDDAGRIVANASSFAGGESSLRIWEDVRTEPAPTRDVDVVLVLDRSGSMSLPGRTGAPKMAEAKEAAALFVSLLTAGANHRVGLVSFSTAATPDRSLSNVNAGTKHALSGAGGIIPLLTAGGMTSIGGGLQTAVGYFPVATPTANTRAILLMTDGLENTAPMIATVEPLVAGSRLNILGFGTAASLDGPRLTTLARAHDGIYVRAEDPLGLKKYFALAFGRIFDLGTALDPEEVLLAGQATSAPVDVDICGETRLTVVLGWANPEAPLEIVVRTPGGAAVVASSSGVEGGSGNTWNHLTVSLPFAGEQDGRWQVVVRRARHAREFGPEPLEQRYFLIALADGGPAFNPLPMGRIYTGDPVNPRVFLREATGERVAAEVTIEIETPATALGEALANQGLGEPTVRDGDVIDARASTLVSMEAGRAERGPLVPTKRRTAALFDDGLHGDGGMEPDGIYGLWLTDLTAFEGTYAFRAIAAYGEGCRARREASWAVHVDVGIDGPRSDVTTQSVGGGKVMVTVTPKDRFGNRLGPGRQDAFSFLPTGPASLDGDPVDNGDGSYGQAIEVGSVGPVAPGLAIAQPDRSPVVISADLRAGAGGAGFGTILGCRAEVVILLAIVFVLAIVVAFLIGYLVA